MPDPDPSQSVEDVLNPHPNAGIGDGPPKKKEEEDSPPWESDTLKVDGEVKKYTREKILELAQKGEAAEKRFQEAATIKKEAEAAMAVRDDVGKMLAGDPDAFRRLGKTFDLPSEEVEAALLQREAGSEGGHSQKGKGEKGSEGISPEEFNQTIEALRRREVSFQNLPKEVRQVLVGVVTDQTEKIIERGVDKDEKLAYYMKGADENGKQAILSLVKDKVRGRIKSSGQILSEGASELSEALTEVGDLLGKLRPSTPSRSTPPLGIGPSPGGTENDLHPRKDPDHVPSTDPEFESHILDLMRAYDSRTGDGST
jgi:hypothetical protein